MPIAVLPSPAALSSGQTLRPPFRLTLPRHRRPSCSPRVASAPPPTAVEKRPEAVAWQFAGSLSANVPTPGAPDWHSAIATLLLTASANRPLPLISAARLAANTARSLGEGACGTIRRLLRDNTCPFAPACAALMRYDFMINPVQRGTGEAQLIFFWREITSCCPATAPDPCYRHTTHERAGEVGARPAPAPQRLVHFPE